MTTLAGLGYLAAVCLFILGLKLLSSPRSARRGNLLSLIGMLIAVLVTLLDRQILDFRLIAGGIIVGGLIGAVLALRVRMTAMPQMVALLNAFGGGASALVALSEFLLRAAEFDTVTEVTTALGVFIGMLTFTGSVVAFAKLQELLSGTPIVFHGQIALNFFPARRHPGVVRRLRRRLPGARAGHPPRHPDPLRHRGDPPRDPDRRGGHAGGHRPPELIFGDRRRRHRVHHQ